MALEKVTYVNDQTVITAEQMNAIQDAIIANEKKIVVSNVAPEDTSALWVDTGDNTGDEIPSGGSGGAKTEKLLDVTLTELTTTLSVIADHNYHRLALVWKGSDKVRMVSEDGTALDSKLYVMLGTSSTGWNARCKARVPSTTKTWKTDILRMDWTDDLSVYLGSMYHEVAINVTSTGSTVYNQSAGDSGYNGTVGDSVSPNQGVEIFLIASSGYFNIGSRFVLVGEYYE